MSFLHDLRYIQIECNVELHYHPELVSSPQSVGGWKRGGREVEGRGNKSSSCTTTWDRAQFAFLESTVHMCTQCLLYTTEYQAVMALLLRVRTS